MAAMERQTGLRAAHGRGAGRPAHPAVVHRRARPARSRSPSRPAELENAFDEGMHFDGSADRRLQPGAGERRARPARPEHLRAAPVGRATTTPSARMFCDIENLDGTPFEGDPRQVLRRNLDRARERGFSLLRRPRDGVLLLRRRRPDGSRSQPLDTGGYFDLTTADVASDLRKRTIHTLEAMGIPVEYSLPRGRPEPARDRPALHRRPDDGRQRHDVPAGRAGDRPRARACYATFMPKPLAGVQGSGMHTHFSLFEGDTNAFHDPGDEYGLSKVGQGLHRRPAAPRAGDHRRHQPVGQLLQAARRRLRGAGLRRRGPATTARRSCNVPVSRSAGKADVDPHRVPGARPGLQPVPRLLGGARRRAEGHRGGLRAARPRPPPTSSSSPPRSGRPRASSSLPAVAGRGARRDGALRAGGRGARRAHLRVVPPQQAGRVGRLQDPGDPVRARPLPSARCEAARRWNRSSSIPDPPPPELAQALDLGGYPWKAVGDERRRGRGSSPTTAGPAPWSCADADPEAAFALCRVAAQARRARSSRCCCSSAAPSSATSSCATTCSTTSASRRSTRASSRPGSSTCSGAPGAGTRPELVEYGDAGAQPRDLPGRHRRPAARPHLHGVRAAQVPGLAPRQGVHPRDAAVAGCGATSTTAAPARSTSTSGACGPSSARSTPT